MSVLLFIGSLVYTLVFLGAMFLNLKFQFGEERKDERGRKILNESYVFPFLLLIFGCSIIHLINELLVPFSFESYKRAILLLVMGAQILQVVILFNLKRK